jgi:hypothetical protein
MIFLLESFFSILKLVSLSLYQCFLSLQDGIYNPPPHTQSDVTSVGDMILLFNFYKVHHYSMGINPH